MDWVIGIKHIMDRVTWIKHIMDRVIGMSESWKWWRQWLITLCHELLTSGDISPLYSIPNIFCSFTEMLSSELFKRAIRTMVHICLSFLLILKVLWREPFSLVLYSTQWGNSGLLPLCFSRKRYRDCSVKKNLFFLDNQESKGWTKIWQDMGWVCLRDIPPDSYLILIPYIFLFCTPTRLKIVRQKVLKFGWHRWCFDWRT